MPSAVRTHPLDEAVALFTNREDFQRAVDKLLSLGFKRSDLSVLSSHESLEAAEKPETRMEEVKTALGTDLTYLGPLAAAGFILLAAGPIAAVAAGILAAGLTGVAAKALMDELTATPHREHFARALEAGAVILWVRTVTVRQETMALAALKECGGVNVHVNRRGDHSRPAAN